MICDLSTYCRVFTVLTDAEFDQTNYTPVADALVHEGFYLVYAPCHNRRGSRKTRTEEERWRRRGARTE